MKFENKPKTLAKEKCKNLNRSERLEIVFFRSLRKSFKVNGHLSLAALVESQWKAKGQKKNLFRPREIHSFTQPQRISKRQLSYDNHMASLKLIREQRMTNVRMLSKARQITNENKTEAAINLMG
ncbi:hypothetical protein [Enterovibrio coralii]|uniref:Uncharacterized protein n=1 Tax=Enterovibrio coralii TaxID=294935 RepID=A0A135I5Q1_9GAMM|nr:hypothetical protein [Enterovibrio coralii]KXF80786.1 hypothetical protein ATN88_16030 [Enterovibrio coralii]